MELTLEMNYDLKTLMAMEKGIRLALQEDRDKKSKWIGWFFAVVGIAVLLGSKSFGFQQVLAIFIICLILVHLLAPDFVHGLMASIKMPANMKKGTWTFREDGFFSTMEMGISGFDYEIIHVMIETGNYMILVFSDERAQVFDLSTLKGGQVADLRRLLRKKTSLTIQTV